MEIATICPTRGLVFKETLSSLKRNGINNFYIDSGNIPEVYNKLVREAMQKYPTYLFFVEDDMVIPDNVIEQMKKADEAIVAVDYAMDNGYSTIATQNGVVIWSGLGCTLVKQGVLQAIGDPWFDTSYSWKIVTENPLKLEKVNNPYKYGGHDINFCIKAREMGFNIVKLQGFEARHLRCKQLDKGKYNKGFFDIKALPKISKYQHYN